MVPGLVDAGRMLVFFEAVDIYFENIWSKTWLVLSLSLVYLIFHASNFKALFNKSSIFLTLMLPVIILFVTQTIATSLYLSLGLIGALSIVRYRTPVKSQYELAYIFGLIAIGIVAGVRPSQAILLTVIISLLPVFFSLLVVFVPRLNDEVLRPQSTGSVDVFLLADRQQVENWNTEAEVGRIHRIETNYEDGLVSMFMTFGSIAEAEEFQKQLPFQPRSISISNA